VYLARLAQRWQQPAGYKEVLEIVVPMVLSTGAWSILFFMDRVFLTWYSSDAIAASLPAGMASFAVVCLFAGTAVYVNTFVAQYHGAKQDDKIGAIIWQGVYLSFLSLSLIIPAYYFADIIFQWTGHEPQILALEIEYFRTLMYAAVFGVLNNTLSSFFLGMKGAAIATNIAIITGVMIYAVMILKPHNQLQFNSLKHWMFNKALFNRLIYFGFPNGLRLFIDMSSFTAFLMIVGMLGKDSLIASNIAFNINALSYIPMMGLMIAASVLVGQHLGNNNAQLAERATWSTLHLGLVFFSILGLLYILLPGLFIWPYLQASEFDQLDSLALVVVLLRFVAFFGLFDATFLIFLGALEGAGDTRFIMKMSFIISVLLMVVPSYFYVKYMSADVIGLWMIITFHVIVYSGVFYRRFKNGLWKEMRVIH
jgi:MATE family multidrug resistance protein